MSSALNPDQSLRRAEDSIRSALGTLKKSLSTIPSVDALGLAWRSTPRAPMPRRQKLGDLRVGKALVEQVQGAIAQLRSQSTSLAQSIQDASEDKLAMELASDRADQMVAIAFALERVEPELSDMVEELDMANCRSSGTHLDFANKLHFTCPVCFDDEVSVQDAFVVSACGHPICRPCAIRSVDFNIKQLQPQVCPSCMGTPCPLCPITMWQRMHDLEERRSRRRMQRRAEMRPDNSTGRQQQQVPGSHGEGSEREAEASGENVGEEGAGRRRRGRRRAAAAAHGAGNEQQHAQQLVQQDEPQHAQQEPEYAGPPPPQVKHCCMTQADMRLLLQPEELQRQQLEVFAQRKQAREQRRQQGQQQQQKQQKQQQQQQGVGKGHKRRMAASSVGTGPAKRRAAAAADAKADSPESLQGKDRHGREQESITILSDSDDEIFMCTEDDTGAEDKGRMRGGGGSRRGGAEGGQGEAAGSGAAAAAAATAAEMAEREKAEEEEEAAELPPTYEAYLKAEALRAVHSGGLFKLCPKCGEGIELIASGPEKNRLRCPTCKCDKCLSCGVDWHEGSTCEQYQQWSRENATADEEFKKLISSGEIQACPRCGTATAKVPGYCDHMRCKCGCTYCYKCGREKTGAAVHNHGCPCMNGAAWRHDWRARLPPGDPRLPPMPGGPRPPTQPPQAQAPLGHVRIRGAPAPAAAAPVPAGAGAAGEEQPRGGRVHQKAHRGQEKKKKR